MNRCPESRCIECGDLMIHQCNRGPHESSSLIGDYIHTRFPRTFDWIDVDGLMWKQSTRRLIFIEHKFRKQGIARSQERIMPVLGDLCAVGIERGVINSGFAMLLHSDPPFANCSTTRWPGNVSVDLDGAAMDQLLQCTPVTPRRYLAGTAWMPAQRFEGDSARKLGFT